MRTEWTVGASNAARCARTAALNFAWIGLRRSQTSAFRKPSSGEGNIEVRSVGMPPKTTSSIIGRMNFFSRSE